jgi:glycosyltransferase involved in cell wall biosynthesis
MDRTEIETGPPASCLRVLYVIPGAEKDTSMSFSRRQAASVGKFGVEIRQFFLKSRTSPPVIARELRRLKREIRKFEPHVVHAHFGTMTAFVAAIASRKPLVITFHGSDLNPAPGDPWLRSKLGHALSHFAANRAAEIICVSPQLRERLANQQARIHVVPCGVNLEQFSPLAKRDCRDRLGWNLDEKIVLFNARTDPEGKRLDLAEAAILHAQRKTPQLRLHVFRGKTHPDDMPIYYSAADALLMTSDYEGSPMVVKEALACNLPVVSVDVGDVVERLQGVTPSAIVPRSPAAIGEALADVLHKNIRSNGRDRVHELSEDHVARTITSIYRLAAHMPASGPRENRIAA